MTTPGQSTYSYKNLEEFEMEEAARILKSISVAGLQKELAEDYAVFKEMDKAEQEEIRTLLPQDAGGRRRTRRAKKHPKRKTRRHKK